MTGGIGRDAAKALIDKMFYLREKEKKLVRS